MGGGHRHYRTRGQRKSVDFSDPRAKQPAAAARRRRAVGRRGPLPAGRHGVYSPVTPQLQTGLSGQGILLAFRFRNLACGRRHAPDASTLHVRLAGRSEEHTSELQSLMRTSYAVFCLKKKTNKKNTIEYIII